MEVTKWPSSRVLQHTILQSFASESKRLTNEQIFKYTSSILGLPPELLYLMHSPTRSELEYRLAWARTKLAKANLIRRVGPKVWEIVP